MYVGIDVSKLQLDVKGSDWERVERYSNRLKEIRQLVKRLKNEGAMLVVLESTGGYERNVALALKAAEMKVAVVNPMRTHNFAKSLGMRAKTDKIDANILCEYAEKIKPDETRVLTADEEELRQLVTRRTQLINQRTQEKNRIEHSCSMVKSNIRSSIKSLNKQIKSITEKMEKFIEVDQSMTNITNLLRSAKGVGQIVAYSLIALLPELGSLNRKQVAALVGVAPYNKDSGNHFGIRSISGGRANIRCVLYMATLSAIRTNVKIKNFYKVLVSKGKKKKVALVACMRKFLVCLNAMIKTGQSWTSPQK